MAYKPDEFRPERPVWKEVCALQALLTSLITEAIHEVLGYKLGFLQLDTVDHA